MANRRLSDLYVRGSELTLDDGEGPITIWVQKLNPVDHGEVARRANAARARTSATMRDHTSDDYNAIVSTTLDYEREQMIDLLVLVERLRLMPFKRSEVADRDEWKDDDYLDGLETSWDQELKARFDEDAEDPDALRVRAELDRFEKAVQNVLDQELDTFREHFESLTDDELREKMIELEVKRAGDTAWIDQYYRWEVFYAVREPDDHKKRYFSDIQEVDELEPLVFGEISAKLRELVVDPSEGKDLAGSPPSSTSFEQPEQEEEGQVSGQKAV